ncbi:hypothetical protein AURDEDRAFT_177554 [Auricularia subglabra TFB-10046 SS5]|uniref:RNase H type-1 domain-containing protein n=1 Tax=Auricularia subglabra (strain TFB-10046 / SS5) TaxID=717982 RepID=J0WNE0_AURST|nr:hypothetical protein AURDEDRAFT_177554 [Auricularia subglabra TFB-10046 SS5]
MGKKAEVYDAEMHAMSSAIVGLENLDNDLGTCTHLYFFADNSSSVEAILQERPGPSQMFSITFCERARDFLAAEASCPLTTTCPPF